RLTHVGDGALFGHPPSRWSETSDPSDARQRPILVDVVSSIVPRFSVMIGVAACVGCGSFGYRPFTVIDPATHADSSVVVATLRLRIHIADERVDVHLENTGADTIVVDWSSAVLTISLSAGDEIPHRLVRSVMLANAASLNNSSRAV